MAKTLEGWKEDGEGLLKWFGDHYKWAPNEEAAKAVDQEAALRAQAVDNANAEQADALRAQADELDPNVKTKKEK